MIHAYVITCMDVDQSMEAAARCITSARRFGLDGTMVTAFRPDDDPSMRFEDFQWPTGAFVRNRYSRPLPCMCCFLSHALLWQKCVEENLPLIVCEHDAIFVREVPDNPQGLCVNLGKPSFGRWKQPPCGVGPLVSGPHFKGAHCYFLHPNGASELLRVARHAAQPVDCYLSLKRFQWLKESFPYSAVCEDFVTTIQNPLGCQAKHRPVTIV